MLLRSTLGACTAVSFHSPSFISPHTGPHHNCIPQGIQYKGQRWRSYLAMSIVS